MPTRSGKRSRRLKSQPSIIKDEDSLKYISKIINETQKDVTDIILEHKNTKLKKYVNIITAFGKSKVVSNKTTKKQDIILSKISVLIKELNNVVYHSSGHIYSELKNIFTNIFGSSNIIRILSSLLILITIIIKTYTYIPKFLNIVKTVINILDKLIDLLLMLLPTNKYESSISFSRDIVIVPNNQDNSVYGEIVYYADKMTKFLVNTAVTSTSYGIMTILQGVISLLFEMSKHGPVGISASIILCTIFTIKVLRNILIQVFF